MFNNAHGAWEYGDYIPFAFVPGTDWFFVNYDINPVDPDPGQPLSNVVVRLIAINAASPNPLLDRIDYGDPSYTFGFVRSGSNTFLLRLNPDSSNGYRLGVYNITNPALPPSSPLQEFHRETNTSSGFPQPIVGNYGFALFTNRSYGVVFDYPGSNP